MTPGAPAERTLAAGIAIGSGYLFPTTFENEVYSDLTGERGVLMGALAGVMEAQYNTLRAHGHSPSEAFNETVEELTQSLIRLVAQNGMDWMYANCSTTAQRGALDWKGPFREAVAPVFDKLYDSVLYRRRDPHRARSQLRPRLPRKAGRRAERPCANPKCGRPARQYAPCALKTGKTGIEAACMNNYVRIFDTTLRDGEQSPGATLTSAEKLEIARALARMGVDVMEAGFPAASPDDLEAVRRIAVEVGQPTEAIPNPPIICGLARATRGDIDKAWEAVQHAAHPRIHTFIATSPIHMQYKLKMDPEQVIERAVEMVTYARSAVRSDVTSFRPEDAGRSDPEFLYLVLGEVIKAGATTLNIPDTVGYTTPEEFGALIAGIMQHTPGIEKCHRLRPLPQRPGTGHRQHPGRPAGRRAPGRSDHQRHRRARRQHLARRSGHGAAHPPAHATTWTPASTPPISRASPRWSPTTPASPSSPTRPSSARMPLPTRPASTRMACSSTRRPTRSCAPRWSA